MSGNGSVSRRVQQRLAILSASKAALLTPSCSAALEMSARLLDLAPGDEVIVPAYAFVTTASSFAWNGAIPVFADVSPTSLSLTVSSVACRVTDRTRAVVVINYGGLPDELLELKQFCESKGIFMIEDNAHGFGGFLNGRPLGSFGHAATLSFHATKNITCGEGGALLINEDAWIERALVLQEKGTDRSQFLQGHVDRYTWQDIGGSWVLSDVLAAILEAQFDFVDEVTRRRRSIWSRYREGLADWASQGGRIVPSALAGVEPAAHIFFIRLSGANEAQDLIEWLSLDGIDARGHYQALNCSPMGRRFGGHRGDCPVAEAASGDLVRLPLHTGLSAEDLDQVISRVRAFRG